MSRFQRSEVSPFSQLTDHFSRLVLLPCVIISEISSFWIRHQRSGLRDHAQKAGPLMLLHKQRNHRENGKSALRPRGVSCHVGLAQSNAVIAAIA